MDEAQIPEPANTEMRAYFEGAAAFMINTMPIGGTGRE